MKSQNNLKVHLSLLEADDRGALCSPRHEVICAHPGAYAVPAHLDVKETKSLS